MIIRRILAVAMVLMGGVILRNGSVVVEFFEAQGHLSSDLLGTALIVCGSLLATHAERRWSGFLMLPMMVYATLGVLYGTSVPAGLLAAIMAGALYAVGLAEMLGTQTVVEWVRSEGKAARLIVLGAIVWTLLLASGGKDLSTNYPILVMAMTIFGVVLILGEALTEVVKLLRGK